ncbi:hypothetical protein [Streptomyces purpureus]|uniref:hypothetical protein n=1 Tax=Streptomyces purpureus TaxID=1951 RepID=UPI000378C784|nr:hypothetical protein [Streptomyces purpureus]
MDPTFGISETPVFTARAVTALAAGPDVARFNGGSLSVGTLAKQYGFTDADGWAPDSVRYFQDYTRTGQAPNPNAYRWTSP